MDIIVRESLSRQVLRGLGNYIVANNLEPGDRLPTERELVQVLGVSRNTIREALKYLEAVGAVSRLPGRGSILQEMDLSILGNVAEFLVVRSADDLTELFVARRLLEVNMIPLIVKNATEEDYKRMETANVLTEVKIRAGGIGSQEDAVFHQALIAAAGNKLLLQFCTLIQQFFRDPRTRHFIDPERAMNSVYDHQKIVALMRNGEIEEAKEAMDHHLCSYVRRGVVDARAVLDAKEVVPAKQDCI